MSDSRSILILYGSQSGNSEDIAIQTGKAAVEYNLLPTVRAMDEITIDEFVGQLSLIHI